MPDFQRVNFAIITLYRQPIDGTTPNCEGVSARVSIGFMRREFRAPDAELNHSLKRA